MDNLTSVKVLFLGTLPCSLDDCNILKLIEDTITAKHYEVVILLDLETLDIWSGNHHLWIASVFGPLGLNITKSPRHRESSWEYSVWAKDDLVSKDSWLGVLILNFGH